MGRILAVLLLGALAAGAFPAIAGAQAPPAQEPSAASSPKAEDPSDLPAMPAAPRGKSTILGGEIRKVDPVRDVLTLKVYGQKPTKILFDERTQVFRDGKKISLRELKPAEHASIQTILDGTNIFALSVHTLSKSPEGDYQGKVLAYNPATTELTISSPMAREPMRILVPAATTVVREGQPAFTAGQNGLSDLTKGTLVSVKFQSDKTGHGVATHVAVLATPGSEFVFIGSVTALDTHTGTLVLLDPRDDKSYPISFSVSGLAGSDKVRLGQSLIVTTNFDGTNYVAKAITIQ